MRRPNALAATLALVAFAPAARAHQDSVTHLQVEAEGRRVTSRFTVDPLDLNELVGAPPSASVTAAGALARTDAALRYLDARYGVGTSAGACAREGHTVRTTGEGDAWRYELTLRHECPRAVETLSLRYGLFFDVDPRHQGMCSARVGGVDGQHVFREGRREVTLGAERPLARQLAGYVSLGVEHILLGYDHLAFLLGLAIVVGAMPLRRAAREVAAMVTAFTAAHSVTLAGAALGLVRAPASVVEPAIALSIALVAFENTRARPPRHRAAVAFAFGLVHGFGFAGVLAEQGLPARAAVPSLVAFNVGVELGQLAMVAAALPVLSLLGAERRGAGRAVVAACAVAAAAAAVVHAGAPGATVGAALAAVAAMGVGARRWGYDVAVRRAGSVALGALGALWFVERVAGRTLFGGALG